MPLTPLSANPFSSRADVARAVIDLFEPLVPYFSKSGARVRLSATAAHFDMAAAELEGFARPLWGIAPLVAGGGRFEHWALYRSGLAAGTDPDHPDYWGDIVGTDQRQVEMAAIAFAILLVPEHIWTPLDAAAKANVIAYFRMVRAHRFVDSNWHFFRVLIDMALTQCGAPVDDADGTAPLDRLEYFRLGNGWYRDGKTRCADHYIPFAFHFYSLIYAGLGGDAARAETYRERARRFAGDFRHWCDPDGAILPFGRSLTYRFAIAGFWGALAFAGVEALPWSEIKGYYMRHLRWWADKPIFDRDGVLSIGYAYPNLMLSEGYNSAGSPYWAMKAFLPLALPEDHPFWTARELAPQAVSAPVALPEPGMVIQHLDGHTVALSTGQQSTEWRGHVEKYGKFAYSTRYGFSVEADDRHFDKPGTDNMLSFSEDGMHMRMRETNETAEIAGDVLRAVWHPYPDVTVETFTLPAGDWHIRLHAVTTPRALETAEGGFAIAKPDHRAFAEKRDAGRAEVTTATDISVIVGGDARTGVVMSPLSNANVMAARTLVPQLRGRVEPGTTLLATAVLARPRGKSDALPPAPDFPDIDDLRRLFAEKGRIVPVFDNPDPNPA